MIARLTGTIVDKQPGSVVVDVGGVGYQVAVPLPTAEEIGELGSPVELHVYTHVREDAIALFGFRTGFEKEIFSRLLGVGGIGPRTALAVLSGIGASRLIEVVRERDVSQLSSIPGIGRKTAERIVVDLTGRIESLRPPGERARPAGGEEASPADLRQDLVSALVNLGYNARVATDAAARVLKGVDVPAAPFQTLLRESLRILSR